MIRLHTDPRPAGGDLRGPTGGTNSGDLTLPEAASRMIAHITRGVLCVSKARRAANLARREALARLAFSFGKRESCPASNLEVF